LLCELFIERGTSMKKTLITLLICFSFLLLMDHNANAVPILNLNNNHYYEVVSMGIGSSISWADARDVAAAASYNSLGGHLVTITSDAERDWINATWPANQSLWFDTSNPLWNHWIGAFQETQPLGQSDPTANWQWVTGEAWGYENWYRTEPNDNAGSTRDIEDNEENYGAFVPLNQWFDYGGWNGPGYMIEYDIPVGNGGNVVPEPTTMLLFSTGFLGALLRRRRV